MEIISEADYSIVELIGNYKETDENATALLEKFIMLFGKEPDTNSVLSGGAGEKERLPC